MQQNMQNDPILREAHIPTFGQKNMSKSFAPVMWKIASTECPNVGLLRAPYGRVADLIYNQ